MTCQKKLRQKPWAPKKGSLISKSLLFSSTKPSLDFEEPSQRTKDLQILPLNK